MFAVDDKAILKRQNEFETWLEYISADIKNSQKNGQKIWV